MPSSGLDQLADVVASSGLSSSRLRKTDEPETKPKPQPNVKMLLIGAGMLIAFLAGALIIALTRDSSHGGPEQTAGQHPEAAQPAPMAKHVDPTMCGLPLKGETIIYVLDRGDSTRDSFGDLKAATLKSINSLGAERKFQIIFWNNGRDDAYPKNWPVYATAENAADAERAIDDIAAHGNTQITSALKKAMASEPSEIVIASGKAWALDESFVQTVDQIRSDKPVRISTIAIGDPGKMHVLKIIAEKAGGHSAEMSENELQDAAR
jgi:hypothetical protein